MPRRLIRQYLPDLGEQVRTHRRLRFLGERLHDSDLWHLNRASASKATAIGLFMALMPIPFQMVGSALGAIVFRANLPIAVVLVWITNPVTMPPIFYFCYRFGAWLLQTRPREVEFEMSLAWFSTELLRVWQPLLLGSVLVAIVASLIGYYGVRELWRWHVLRDRERRVRSAGRRGVDAHRGADERL